jgi:membrane protein DedA with SNARE-associated domain
MLVASITSSVTSAIGNHGLYAVFGLMIVAAVLPAASELTMLYGGALAAGAFASAHVNAFGHSIGSHGAAYVAIALAGIAGNVLGALLGWLIGRYVGIEVLERTRFLHVTPARLERAHRWFERFGGIAVPVGFMTPGIRSFVAIPAGIARMPLGRFLLLAALGCTVFCFGLAAGGWAVGSSYGSVRRYLDYVVLAALVLLVAWLIVRWRRAATKLATRGPDPAG